MSPKELWLASMRMQPVERLPFWPKLDAAYPRAQCAPFDQMSIDEIHDWIGSDKHMGVGSCLRERRRHTSVDTERSNGLLTTVYRTTHGDLRLVQRFDPGSQSWHPVQFPVRSAQDIDLMIELYSDCVAYVDEEALERNRAIAEQIGDTAVTATTVGESPLMYWVEWLAGVENAHYLLADHTERVEELFTLIHQSLVQKTRLVVETSPADLIYFSENTSTTLISPEQYRRYCYPHISDYASLARDADRLMVLHMCGHLKDVLQDLSRLPVAGFEAFTSPTLGNTTLLDGRRSCPDKCLVGGTNATLWTKSAHTIIAQIERDLGELPHHRGTVVTSAGVMTPLCNPQTIREVCDWVKGYTARM